MVNNEGPNNTDIVWAGGRIAGLRAAIAEVVLGQEKVIDALMGTLLGAGHALLVGVPGVAKTLLCRTLASSLGLEFSRIQFTPDLLPADITGAEVFEPGQLNWRVSKGPLFANFVLADEINRAPAKVQSALLEAMQEHQVTLGGKAYRLPDSFMVVATQNPVEMEGVFPLPEAQQDRFMARIDVDYPPAREEARMALEAAMGKSKTDPIATHLVLGKAEVSRLQAIRSHVAIDPRLSDYAVDLMGATRSGKLAQPLRLGASPRATQALLVLAQAKALMDGRCHIVPEDMQAMTPLVLMHRLVPDESLGWTSQDLGSFIQSLLDQVSVP